MTETYEPQSNPWAGAMLVTWILCLFLGLVLLVVGAAEPTRLDPNPGLSGAQMFGVGLLGLGGMLLVGWMACMALRWQPDSALDHPNVHAR